jgi:hypothetical protein
MWYKCELYKHVLNICNVDNVLIWCPPCKLKRKLQCACVSLDTEVHKTGTVNKQQPASAAAILTRVCA